MTREELVQLRDAIDVTLALPESIREMLAQWLAPTTAKANGHDLSPPVPPPAPKAAPAPRIVASRPYDNPAHARSAEKKLLAAMRAYPGLSAAGLAKTVSAGLSTRKERLRRMGAQELIEKAPDGRWQVRAEEPRDTGEEPGPTVASPLEATPQPEPVELQSAPVHAPWVKSILSYERRQTTVVEGLRYG